MRRMNKVSDAIQFYMHPAAKRKRNGQTDKGLSKGQWVRVVSILDSAAGSLADEQWLYSDKPLNGKEWNEKINSDLLPHYDQQLPRINDHHSRLNGFPIEFEHFAIIAWMIDEPPQPFKIKEGDLVLTFEEGANAGRKAVSYSEEPPTFYLASNDQE